MAQVLVRSVDGPRTRSFKRLSFVDVVEDGVHWGTQILGRGRWDSPPLPGSGFWILDIFDAQRADCLFVVQPEYQRDQARQIDLTVRKRQVHIDETAVPPAVLNSLMLNGRATISLATLISIARANANYA